ncbi:hypothetical protein [Oscillatoria sp. HE19RPO]|nr:hypothetical protein [Oscillatoria sp. HE19RPO]
MEILFFRVPLVRSNDFSRYRVTWRKPSQAQLPQLPIHQGQTTNDK